MPDQLALVLLVIAVVVLLATVLVWLRPLLSPGRIGSAADERPGSTRPTSTGPLARGFGYLFAPLGLPPRQRSIGGRLERALSRIDSIDPHATHRRIGLALLPGDDATEEPLPTVAPPGSPWAFPAEYERRESPDD